MSREQTLLIPLGGYSLSEAARGLAESHGRVETFRLPMLGTREGRALLSRRFDRLVVTGSPAQAEIGFGFVPLVAAAVRPRTVVLFDDRTGSARTVNGSRFAVTTLPRSIAQFAASGAAIPLQRAGAAVVGRPQATRRPSGRLSTMLYLRPNVGSGAAFGGSVTHAHELIRALTKLGVDVVPLTTDEAIADAARDDPDPPCRWTLLQAASSLKALPATAAVADDAALVRAGLRIRPDVVYQRHARFTLAGAVVARLTRRPLFLEYNASEVFTGTHWVKTPMLRQLARCEDAVLRAAARIFVVSEIGRRELVDRGVPSDRIVVNPNGVTPERFARGGGSEVRRRFGFDERDIVVGFVGTFGPWHGAPLLARAFATAYETNHNLRAIFVGDGPELEATRRELMRPDLEAAAHFVGRVRAADVPLYLDACDILASPQVPLAADVDFFGSPTKLFEYMAAGKAIVASRLGQMGDVLEDGRTALLVEPGDEVQLVAAISKLARSSPLRKKLGAAARDRARDSHTWTASAQRVLAAYADLR